MSIYEPSRAQFWLDAKLASVVVAAGAAGIWPKIAPEEVPPSAVVVLYNLQAGTDVSNASAVRLWHSGLYLVKVTGPATAYDTICAVMDVVDNALQLQGEEVTGPNNDAYLMRCDREQTINLPPTVINGVPQETLAALWRIYIRSLVG